VPKKKYIKDAPGQPMPRQGKRGVHTRDELEREKDLEEVARLTRLGYSQSEIVVKLGGRICRQQVAYDLDMVRKRHLDSMIEDRRVMAMEALAGIRDIRMQAWEAWERSQQDAESLIDESKTVDGMTTSKQVHRKSGQCGNPEFLRIWFDTWDREIKLLGLDEAVKIDITSEGNRINWHEMTRPMVIQVDPIEEIIRQEREQGLISMREDMESAQDTGDDNG
jgi:hypothetical protein